MEQFFIYNPQKPLLFTSGFFLIFFTVFLFIYNSFQNKIALRNFWVTIVSIYFYYLSSGFYLLLMMATSLVIFLLGIAIENFNKTLKAKNIMIAGIILLLVLLGYYKYYNFTVSLLNDLFQSNFELKKIFLPLGISFYTFELICYLVDVYQQKTKAERNPVNFFFYVSFFPHLVAGPIVRPNDLFPQINKVHFPSNDELGKGVYLIIAGLFKKSVISDYISLNFVDRIFDNPTLYTGFENLMATYGYTLQIYCDFSGYTDMAMGIALLMGFHLPDNFNQPYISSSLTEFWKRWHISLSSWLRDYLYIPLGGNKKGKWRTYFNLMITMLLGGLWHGASLKFIFWGGLHGLWLALERITEKLRVNIPVFIRRPLGVLITFHLVSFLWIFFRAPDFEQALQVINKVISPTQFKTVIEISTAYKNIFGLIAFGFILHLSPIKWSEKIINKLGKWSWISLSFILALAILLVIQIKTSALQPFIYFQF